MEFLPDWPLRFNELLLFSLLLGAGMLGGHLAGRTAYLPRITGYIAAGFVLGPDVLGLLTADLLAEARLFTDIALGLILFELGRLLDLDKLKQSRWLFATGLLQCLLTFVLVFGALRLAGVSLLNASLAAAVGVSSSPAVILMVTRQLRARGVVTDSALLLVALNNIVAFFLFLTLLPLLHIEQQANVFTIVLQPLYQLAVSIGIALALTLLFLAAARHIGPRENIQFALTVGVIIAALGLAKVLNVSTLLTLLALGFLSHNLDRRRHVLPVEFGHSGELFFLILFVVAGASLHVRDLLQGGLLAVLFVLARQAGISLATYGAAHYVIGLPHRPAAMVGLTLTPMAGMAIGLSQMTYDLYPHFGRELQVIVLAAIVILETIGPIATEIALKTAGEVAPNERAEH